jgi:hypothetical protein
MIIHSVFFRLNHEPDSEGESSFFKKASLLETIPGVADFKVLKEISPKNPFRFGFSMEFSDQAAYDAYSNHPDHVQFVQQIWLSEVAEFQEIDYVEYQS